MLINRFKDCTNTLLGYCILYIITEKTLDSLSRIASSVRFKKDSQKEIQVVALNKTNSMHLSVFSSKCGEVAGIPCLREFYRRLWRKGGTLDVSARKLMKLCLNLKAQHMSRDLDNFSKLSNSLG